MRSLRSSLGRTLPRLLIAAGASFALAAGASALPISFGDVFVSYSKSGQVWVRHYNSSLTLLESKSTGHTTFGAGMAFDGNGDLWVVNFNDPYITKFDHTDFMNPTVDCNTGATGEEDILFDNHCCAYIGST